MRIPNKPEEMIHIRGEVSNTTTERMATKLFFTHVDVKFDLTLMRAEPEK